MELSDSTTTTPNAPVEIGHILFIDIVGYSKLLTNEQRDRLAELNRIVRETEAFRAADAQNKLIRLPTGDGMVLAFFTTPDAPAWCAMSIQRALKQNSPLQLRMGIHSGPVEHISHVDDRPNLAGAGVNMAQRVMNCGDAGHILISARAAHDLAEVGEWKAKLHPLGEAEVKHGARIGLFNLYDDEIGNAQMPQGIRKSRTQSVRRRWVLRAGLVLGVVVTAAAVWRAMAPRAPNERSIAVLPFKPLVPEGSDPVLEIGMADTLITKLSGSADLVVASLTSVRAVSSQDSLAAGRKLGVKSVLEGNVQKAGDRLRVSVRLIEVSDGKTLWSSTFNEQFTDVFTVQDIISQKVAEALALRLNRETRERLTKRYTDNVAAYQLYLAGRFHWNKFTPPDLRKSIEFFEQAIQVDPDYALAYYGLGDAYRALGMTGAGPPADLFPKSKSALAKALQIDDSLADAHAALSVVHVFFDWDWKAAEQEARRAVTLDANSGAGHLALAQALSTVGRHTEAIREAARGCELDRVSPINSVRYGAFLYLAREYDKAIAPLQRTLEIDPYFWIAHYYLGKSYFAVGKVAEAGTELQRAVELTHGHPEALGALGYFFARTGNEAAARRALDQLHAAAANRYVSSYHVALVQQALGDTEATFASLTKAFQEREPRMSWLKVEPSWDALRRDARFADMLQRLALE